MYYRECPNINNNNRCKKIICYQHEYNCTKANNKNVLCSSCNGIKSSIKGIEKKRLTGNWGIDTKRKNGTLNHTQETKNKISNAGIGHVAWNKGLTKETDNRVAKTGKSRPGKLNPMYGRSYKDIWKSTVSDEVFNEKMVYNGYLKSHSKLEYPIWKESKFISNTSYKQYCKLVWYYTNKNDLSILDGYSFRGKQKKSSIKYTTQLDHIISIKVGFDLGILPIYIGSIENLRFLTSYYNSQKNKNLSYTDCYGATNSAGLMLLFKWKIPPYILESIN